MSATNQLRADHDQVRRLEKIIAKCSDELYQGKDIPMSDIYKIAVVISEFVDTIHHSRGGGGRTLTFHALQAMTRSKRKLESS